MEKIISIELQGKRFPVVYADDDGIRCPYCSHWHIHGKGDGHRLSHCSINIQVVDIKLSDGTVCNLRDGYYVKYLNPKFS